jgi:hypothetical protein
MLWISYKSNIITNITVTPSLLYNRYRVFPGGKAAGALGADHPPPSSAEVKKK